MKRHCTRAPCLTRREGTVDITINGQPHRLGPGSAAFAASNDEHSIKNVGTASASYFVVAIGPMT